MTSILVIDDDDMILKLIKTVLERGGYEVTVASSPEEGIETFERTPEKYDLVITDMSMPMDGYAVEEKIRSIRIVPVMFCTGKQVDGKLVLSKPFTIDVLRSEVEHALKGD